jgi:hypothetical protein
MSSSSTTCIGIDLTTGRRPFVCVALDNERNLFALLEGGLDDALDWLDDFPDALVAGNAPSRLARDVGGRAAERDLLARGISVPKTPHRENLCPSRTRLGLSFYQHLEKKGFRSHPSDRADRLWLETNSHAVFCALIGHAPLPRRTLEGRLQRQLVLYEQDLNIADPMDFFEEITRHRLLAGQLPMEQLSTSSHLDALAAAYVAWLAVNRPAETTRLGTSGDGFIVLPVGEREGEGVGTES